MVTVIRTEMLKPDEIRRENDAENARLLERVTDFGKARANLPLVPKQAAVIKDFQPPKEKIIIK